MEENVFLILHGWGGNKPEHWQEHLYTRLTEAGQAVYYPQMPRPEQPDLAAWLAAIRNEIMSLKRRHPDDPLTVVCHSLGSIAWMHIAAGCHADADPLADRVMLVAPPYIMPEAPPPDAPPGVTGFFPPHFYAGSLHAICPNTFIVASDTDDYSTYDQSCGYAKALDIPIYKLEGAGHISPYYGYGEWPWAAAWCLGQAELPPLPR